MDHIGQLDSKNIVSIVNDNWKGFEDVAVLQIESPYSFDYIRPSISSVRYIKVLLFN